MKKIGLTIAAILVYLFVLNPFISLAVTTTSKGFGWIDDGFALTDMIGGGGNVIAQLVIGVPLLIAALFVIWVEKEDLEG